jgi:hypothetical protein
VIEVLQDEQRLLDQRMAALALDICDKTDAARVMLVLGRIKPATSRIVQGA